MEKKTSKKRRKLSKKQEEKRKLAKSLKNKQYYAKRKREKDILNGIEPKHEIIIEEPKIKKLKREFCMIALSSHKQVIDILYKSNLQQSAYKKFNEIIDENEKNIIFPVKYISNKNISKGIVESNYEILLLKIKKEGEDVTQLRNEYGQLVNHVIVDNSQWIIMDKHIYYKEESFWVYGFNPKTQRKDFNYILNEIVLAHNNDKNYFKRIMIFKNKLIIQYDFDIDMVICKNQEDAIRLYNELEVKTKKAKCRNVFFNGIVVKSNKDWIMEMIMNKTGWNKQKVIRSSTKP